MTFTSSSMWLFWWIIDLLINYIVHLFGFYNTCLLVHVFSVQYFAQRQKCLQGVYTVNQILLGRAKQGYGFWNLLLAYAMAL
jgi:hypothetical protein